MRVLYDGWNWVYAPESPAAWRLARWLQRLPAGVDPVVALPAPKDLPWPAVVHPVPPTAWGRLRWEQWVLPRLARRVGARRLHAFHGVPLWAAAPVVLDGTPPDPAEGPLARRLRAALSQGALRSGRHRLGVGADDPKAPLPTEPPPPSAWQAPTPYMVAYGPWPDQALHHLIQSWVWAAPGMGDTQLYLVGLNPDQRKALETWRAEATPWGESVHPAPPLPPWETLGLLRGARAVVMVSLPPYWQEVAGAALALGCPIVGDEMDALAQALGPAGFLVPPGDSRALAGALIALVTEQPLVASLREAETQRAAEMPPGAWTQRLWAVYQEMGVGD